MTNRDTTALRTYHQRTKHSVASVAQSSHGLDWEIMPRPFKVYVDLEPLPLPRDFDTSTRPVLATLTSPPLDAAAPPLDLRALARLLFFSAGIVRSVRYPRGEMYFRAAACTGALYHIDVYVVCSALPDLAAGVYHFSPHDFALRCLRPGDYRATLLAASGDAPAVAAAPATLVLTSTFWRNSWKYQSRAYRHCFWDAGTLLANLLAVARASALPVETVLGYVDTDVDALLGIDGQHEASLALVPLGRGTPTPPPSPPWTTLSLITLPLSSEEIEYPAIAAAHRASGLTSAAEVVGWRSVPSASEIAPTGDVVRLEPLPADTVAEPVEKVILRRGSARRFPHTALSQTELATVLASAATSIPSDRGLDPHPLVDLYVIVHAVDGVPPGSYLYDPARQGMELLRAGDFRRTAGHLDLGQSLAADAAINCYWLCDLEPVLARYGNRGYRVVQMEGAIAGGRTYLAAYALGLAATGLTFFDDDVTAFFSPHAAGKSVLFLTAIGRQAPRG